MSKAEATFRFDGTKARFFQFEKILRTNLNSTESYDLVFPEEDLQRRVRPSSEAPELVDRASRLQIEQWKLDVNAHAAELKAFKDDSVTGKRILYGLLSDDVKQELASITDLGAMYDKLVELYSPGAGGNRPLAEAGRKSIKVLIAEPMKYEDLFSTHYKKHIELHKQLGNEWPDRSVDIIEDLEKSLLPQC